jgi:uncharacterized protein YbcV (DUF1398 family)
MTVITKDTIGKMEDCVRGSLSGTMTFPDVLNSLKSIGVERYHADYSRQEITYYLANGQSHVVSSPHPEHATAQEFSAEDVAAAVCESQRGEHSYHDFVRKTMEAGCVGYFVQLDGRRVQYFGRKGEIHTETFPT